MHSGIVALRALRADLLSGITLISLTLLSLFYLLVDLSMEEQYLQKKTSTQTHRCLSTERQTLSSSVHTEIVALLEC